MGIWESAVSSVEGGSGVWKSQVVVSQWAVGAGVSGGIWVSRVSNWSNGGYWGNNSTAFAVVDKWSGVGGSGMVGPWITSGISGNNWGGSGDDSNISVTGMSVGFVGQVLGFGGLVDKGFYWYSIGINHWKMLSSIGISDWSGDVAS